MNKKEIKKIRICITLDRVIHDFILEVMDELMLNKSATINSLLFELLKKEGEPNKNA